MAAAILKAMSKMEAIVSSFALQNTPALQFTIGDKIVETLSSNGITSKNKTIRTPPPSRPLKVGVFLVFNRQLEQRHNVAWRGQGGKDLFPPFKVGETSDQFCGRLQGNRPREKEKKNITLSSLHFRVSSSTALDQSACEKSLCYCKT